MHNIAVLLTKYDLVGFLGGRSNVDFRLLSKLLLQSAIYNKLK